MLAIKIFFLQINLKKENCYPFKIFVQIEKKFTQSGEFEEAAKISFNSKISVL